MLITVMLTGVFFTAVFIAADYSGLNSLGQGQLVATEINCVLTALMILALRGRKHLYGLVSKLFVVVNYATFVSALILVVNDELRVIWFFVELVMVYILLGLRAGAFMTVVTVATILLANRFIVIPFSRNAMTTLLIGLGVTSLISWAYTSRAQSYFMRLQQSKRDLQMLAEKDPLTGLLNPRAYYNLVNRMIGVAQRSSSPCSVLFIDLDHFKAINDDYGHEAGDVVLRTVAHCLAGQLRGSDVLGRIGGEEFSAFLSDTSIEGAAMLAEKLRSAVQSLDLAMIGARKPVISASIGVAGQRKGDHSIADILRRADKAMYRAKNEGRNRVVVDAA